MIFDADGVYEEVDLAVAVSYSVLVTVIVIAIQVSIVERQQQSSISGEKSSVLFV